MKSVVKIVTAAMICTISIFPLGAEAAQFTRTGHSSNTGSENSVTRADFERLQGQVQALEGRVAALERMSDHSGRTGTTGKTGRSGKTSGDSWTNH